MATWLCGLANAVGWLEGRVCGRRVRMERQGVESFRCLRQESGDGGRTYHSPSITGLYTKPRPGGETMGDADV